MIPKLLLSSLLFFANLSGLRASALSFSSSSTHEDPPSCDTLRAAKAKTYGYHISELTEQQIDAKSKELDAFWKQVEAAGPQGVTCIRDLLAEEKTDHVFQFDAANMLFPADPSLETLTLIRNSLEQTDFQDSDPANYLSLAMDLGQAGVDIRPLAAKLLLFPNTTIHIAEHDLDLDSDTAALVLYGSIDPTQATSALIGLLQSSQSVVRSEAAHLLAEQMNEDSFRALSAWDGTSKVDEEFRRNDIQAVMKFQAINPGDYGAPKFTREQVLQTVAGLPHSQKELEEVSSTKGAAFDKEMRDKKATQKQIADAVANGLPIYGIADHTTFINSAILTLQAGDFETIREVRRKSLYDVSTETLNEYLAYTQIMIGMLNHLDLFKDYRQH
jgi:protein-tyrosine-phosphatase